MDEKLRHRFEALVDFALERGSGRGGDDMTAVAGELTMLDVLQGFVHELRVAGLPVSMTENLDAMRAVEHVPLENRDTFKAALGATLVKHHGHGEGLRLPGCAEHGSLVVTGNGGQHGQVGGAHAGSRWSSHRSM